MPRRKRLTEGELVPILINKMFEVAGHDVSYDEIKDRKDNWFTDWTMTVKQNDEWVKWMQELFRKELKLTKHSAEMKARMCSLMWGLKYSDFENHNK